MRREDDNRIEELDDYVRGVGDGGDALEDDLFARALDGEAGELAFLDGIVAGVRDLVERGTFDPWISAAEAQALRARYGDRAAFVSLGAEPHQRVVVPVDAEILITRIPLDLRGVTRVDLELRLPEVGPVKTLAAIRFDPADGAVYGCCEGDLARRAALPGVTSLYWSIEGETRRLLRAVVTDTTVESAD